MSSPALCLFHADCADGFAAAWVVRRAIPNAEFIAVDYNKPPPDVKGRDVLIVDFSYKRPVMEVMVSGSKSLIVLDHHKTAEEELRFLMEPNGMDWWCVRDDNEHCAIFDMNRSGAGLTWDYFNPGKQRPLFIDYIEDRDLWRKQLAGGDEFTFALRSYPQDFEVWDQLIGAGVGALIDDGVPIKRYYDMRVKEMLRQAFIGTLVMAGTRYIEMPLVNAPRIFASELAGALAQERGMGASFFQRDDGLWEYSLRSRNTQDVSEVAKLFGGGGHAKAAGFAVPALVHQMEGA